MNRKYRFAIAELGMEPSRLPPDILERCEPALGFVDRRMDEDALIDLVRGAEAVFFSSRDAMTRRVLEAEPRLRMAMKFGGKPTNIDFAAAAERGVAVGWTPGANVRSVAEYSVFLAIGALRRVDRGLSTLAAGGWRSAEHIGLELEEKTVGVIGLGAIGRIAARLFAALGARVVAYDPHQPTEIFVGAGARPVALDELLATADVLTLHCELNDSTRHLINAGALARMKPGAVVVNTGRGELIDESELVAALEGGRLGGAALDVFAEEPLPAEHAFRTTKGVLATPHIAARSREALERERFWALRGAIAFLDGAPVERAHLVLPDTSR